ncbi:MAG: ATP-binding protein [Bacteroidaceae bacterium]|nr:ATP-binding protein [Bacteroidaceae bacterium]
MQRTLELNNDIAEIPQLSAFIDTFAEEAGIDFSLVMSLQLALEEAVVNVMEYAYPKGTMGKVLITASVEGNDLEFVISDSGKAFDPTAKAEVNVDLGVEDRPIGGLGIHLVRNIMDSVAYERKNGKNILTLRKRNSGNESGIDFEGLL